MYDRSEFEVNDAVEAEVWDEGPIEVDIRGTCNDCKDEGGDGEENCMNVRSLGRF